MNRAMISGYLADASAAAGEVEDIAFDADGMQRIIDDTKELISRHLSKAKEDARDYTQGVLMPPDHPAGDDFVWFARQHGERYIDFNEKYVQSLIDFVNKLQRLRRDYINREEDLSWGSDKGAQL